MQTVSIVVPMYNEKEVVHIFFDAVEKVIAPISEKYNFEIIAVNDGSKDNTLELLKEIQSVNDKVGVVNLSRNFGHEAAVAAGLQYSSGDAVIVMDADLQDPPNLITKMLVKWEQGYDVVNAKRASRKEDTFLKRWTAKKFYQVINQLSGKIKIPENVGNYRLMSRRVVDEINALPEKNRVFRVLVNVIGYPTTEVEFERPKRAAGETHYNWSSMFRLAIDGITSATTVPLKFATQMGIFTALAGFLYMLVIIYQGIFTKTTIQGWASTMSVILFLGGIQLIFLGIIGEYIGRIFMEVKDRPIFSVEKFLNPTNKK